MVRLFVPWRPGSPTRFSLGWRSASCARDPKGGNRPETTTIPLLSIGRTGLVSRDQGVQLSSAGGRSLWFLQFSPGRSAKAPTIAGAGAGEAMRFPGSAAMRFFESLDRGWPEEEEQSHRSEALSPSAHATLPNFALPFAPFANPLQAIGPPAMMRTKSEHTWPRPHSCSLGVRKGGKAGTSSMTAVQQARSRLGPDRPSRVMR